MFDSLRKWLGSAQPAQPAQSTPPPAPAAEEKPVPEMSVDDLRAAQSRTPPLLVVDVRERYELAQARLPDDSGFTVLHIPMNSIPARLNDLPKGQPIAILCAHGNRSYGVAHYLIEQGYDARSVAGGITRWIQAGGAYTRG